MSTKTARCLALLTCLGLFASPAALAQPADTEVQQKGEQEPAPEQPANETSAPPPVPKEETAAGVVEDLLHARPIKRWHAAVTCGRRRLRAGLPRLTQLLMKETNTRVRKAAAWALGRIGDQRAAPHLQSAAWSDLNAEIRAEAHTALRLLGVPTRMQPYWEWEEYKSALTGRKAGKWLMIGGGVAGGTLLLIGLVGGIACNVANDNISIGPFSSGSSNDGCEPWSGVLIAGSAIFGAGIISGLPLYLFKESQLKTIRSEASNPLPMPSLAVNGKGARVGLTWRF